MGIFKKDKSKTKDPASEQLFKDAVREVNELYDDLKSEYADVEAVIVEFSELIDTIKEKLDSKEISRLEDFAIRLRKVNSYARNSVRDIRDVLRNHKKRLNEINRDRD